MRGIVRKMDQLVIKGKMAMMDKKEVGRACAEGTKKRTVREQKGKKKRAEKNPCKTGSGKIIPREKRNLKRACRKSGIRIASRLGQVERRMTVIPLFIMCGKRQV